MGWVVEAGASVVGSDIRHHRYNFYRLIRTTVRAIPLLHAMVYIPRA